MITPTREDLVRLRFDEGMSRESIAAHYGVSVATVRRWIKELKVPRQVRLKKVQKVKSDRKLLEPYHGYTKLEVARIKLGGRVVERLGYGYYLDGTLVGVDRILEAAEQLP